MSRSLVFELPLPEALGNHRMHWAVKNKRKLAYYAQLDALVTLQVNPKPVVRWAKATADIQMRTWRRMDRDGAHSRVKWILDWLETRGYIENDRELDYQLDPRTASRADLGVTLVLREAA